MSRQSDCGQLRAPPPLSKVYFFSTCRQADDPFVCHRAAWVKKVLILICTTFVSNISHNHNSSNDSDLSIISFASMILS